MSDKTGQEHENTCEAEEMHGLLGELAGKRQAHKVKETVYKAVKAELALALPCRLHLLTNLPQRKRPQQVQHKGPLLTVLFLLFVIKYVILYLIG